MSSRRRSGGYSVPCVYCKEGTSFPSLEALKKHLISSHGDLVTGRKVDTQDHRNVERPSPRTPTTDVLRSPITERISYGSSPNSTPSSVAHSSKTHPVSEPTQRIVHSIDHFSERKLKRLNDNLQRKDKEIEELTKQNDDLKQELLLKDEQHNQLRQRWRKEGEDAIRYLKSNYDDVLAQKQMLEWQLYESENEKLKIRNEKDKIVKDHTDLQIKAATEKRNTQQQQQQESSTDSTNKKLNSEIKNNKILSDENKQLKKEREDLLAETASKDNAIKELQLRIQTAQFDLIKERIQNDANKLEVSRKGSLSQIEENLIETNSGSIADLTAKLKRLESYQNQREEELVNELNTLKNDKNRLIKKLNDADDAFTELSQHLKSSSDTNIRLPAASSFINPEIQASLDQILNVVKHISDRKSNSTKQEETRLSTELHRVNLLLLEEKENVKRLNLDLIEMEKLVSSKDEDDLESEKRVTELKILRSKHQKCMKNEKIRKHLKSEKKILLRKLREEEKQHQLLAVLFNSLKNELKHKDDVMKDMRQEKKEMEDENKRLSASIIDIRQNISDHSLSVEKYKRENCYLLEKLNIATEDLETLKNQNSNLQTKLENLDVIESNVKKLQVSIHSLTENNRLSLLKSDVVEPLVQNNIQLTKEIIKLQRCLHDEGLSFEKLKEKISELQQWKESRNSDMINFMGESAFRSNLTNSSKETTDSKSFIENLKLEKEILSSRVLILEGIREEMEILRMENDKLKEENECINKRIMTEYNENNETSLSCWTNDNSKLAIKSTILSSNEDTEEEILYNLEDREFFDSVKTLDFLCEDDKVELRAMLSTPNFEEFLSTSQVVIDLHNNSDDSAGMSHATNLSEEQFQSEHTVNHIFSANLERSDDVMENHVLETDEENEQTINYMSLKTDVLQPINQKVQKQISEPNIRSNNSLHDKPNKSSDHIHDLIKNKENLSQISQNLENTKSKSVKFSDPVDVIILTNKGSTPGSTVNKIVPDDSLYKSYYKEALNKNFPELFHNDNEDGDDEQDSDISFDSNTNVMNQLQKKKSMQSSSSVSSNDMPPSTIENSTEKNQQLISVQQRSETDSSSFDVNKNPKYETTSSNFSSDDSSKAPHDRTSRRSSLNKDSFDSSSGSSNSSRYAAVAPRPYSYDDARLFKGLDILPLINEMEMLTSASEPSSNSECQITSSNFESDSSSATPFNTGSSGASRPIKDSMHSRSGSLRKRRRYTSSSPFTSDDGLFKGMDVLPLIHELDISSSKTNFEDASNFRNNSTLKRHGSPRGHLKGVEKINEMARSWQANCDSSNNEISSQENEASTSTRSATIPSARLSSDVGILKGVDVLPLINERDIFRYPHATPVLPASSNENVQNSSSVRRFSLDSDNLSGYESDWSWFNSGESAYHPNRFLLDSENPSDYHDYIYYGYNPLVGHVQDKPCSSSDNGKTTDYNRDVSSQEHSDSSTTIHTTDYLPRPSSVETGELLKKMDTISLMNRTGFLSQNDNHISMEKKDSAINALNVLKSFIKKAGETKPDSSGEGTSYNRNDTGLFETVLPDRTEKNNSVDNISDAGVPPGVGLVENNGEVLNNTSLFLNENESQLKNTNAGDIRNQLTSTPSKRGMEKKGSLTTSQLHLPATLNFSDGSFEDYSSFKNSKDDS